MKKKTNCRGTDTAGRRRAGFRTGLVVMLVTLSVMVVGRWAAADQGALEKTSPVASRAAWPQERSDLLPDPDILFGRLDNGFRYALMTNSEPAGRVSLHLNVQAGSMNEREDQRGAAHFLEHMQFNGSEHFQPGELVKYFQRIGMQFGPDANARTGFTDTVYDILLPSGDAKSIDEGLLVLKDYASGALLLESEIDRERPVILAEKRTRDSAGYRTFKATLAFELGKSLPPRRLPIGIEPTIRQMDRKRLKDFYDTWYRPETMMLVMVGDFKVAQARPLIEKIFADLPLRPVRGGGPDFGRFTHQGVNVLFHPEDEAGNTSVSIETLVQVAPEPDSSAFQADRLARDVADRMVQDRLDTMLRKAEAPFTSARIGSGRFLRRVAYSQISADCSPEKWALALAQIEQTLRQALAHGFNASELQRVKLDFMSELDDAVKKAPTRKSQTLANQIIRQINNDRVVRSPLQEKQFFAPRLQALTLADVNRVFKETWAADHRLVLVTGNVHPAKTVAEAEKRIRDVYEKSRSVAVSKPDEVETVGFPYLPQPGSPGKIARRERIADLGIVQIDFANGNRLNLKPTDFKVGTVRFKLVFGRGRSSQPPRLPGLADLTRALVNESGLGRLDRDQLDRAFAGRQTAIRFNVEEDRFAFSGESVPGELALMFQLIDAHVKDPGYRKSSFDLSMERYRQRYQAMAGTIKGGMTLAGARFLAGGDNRFGLPSLERFGRLTLAQVRDWVDPVLKNAPLELSIVGDFDLQEAERLGALYLGSLPRRTLVQHPIPGRHPRFPGSDSLTVPVASRIPKSLVVVAFGTDDIWDIGRTRRLAVLADIVSDRLRQSIREQLGEAYSPFAVNRPSRAYDGYGLFQVFVQVAPEAVPRVRREVEKIRSDLVSKGITQDELNRALDPTLTSIKDLKRQNQYWLNTVLAGSRDHPEQIQWCRSISEDYAAIEVADLLPLIKKYLGDQRGASVVVVVPQANASGSSPDAG